MELYEFPNTVHSDANRQLEISQPDRIAAMGQYPAEDGQMNDWRLMHLGQLASYGAALLTIGGTAVTPDGRTTEASKSATARRRHNTK
ncbi:MAG TPA: hypothetical protein VFF50_02440 [Candidatus Deferrimicrobiaceae bacterium]|jgi:2,4-dienoyl-CoA reductase-like NADH-dependent reductase (Old Yellow Enzyme family)|nr:hypothetical protein [Candidatus Deferrimicrobiaceae bacterium]